MTLAQLAQLSHYEVLGVEYEATTAEIDAAYRERMLEYPRSPWRRLLLQARTGRSVRSLAAARETLTQASSRARYDASLRSMFFWLPPL
jgi:DnaJ-class molecular chaperone